MGFMFFAGLFLVSFKLLYYLNRYITNKQNNNETYQRKNTRSNTNDRTR